MPTSILTLPEFPLATPPQGTSAQESRLPGNDEDDDNPFDINPVSLEGPPHRRPREPLGTLDIEDDDFEVGDEGRSLLGNPSVLYGQSSSVAPVVAGPSTASAARTR